MRKMRMIIPSREDTVARRSINSQQESDDGRRSPEEFIPGMKSPGKGNPDFEIF
jgi:hypothetical protein